MYYRTAYVPGGQALGGLETIFAKISKRIGKLFARNGPRSAPPDAGPQIAPAQ
jgi:lipopolysaccharide export system permease protein